MKKKIEIAELLPNKEDYSVNKAAAASIWVKDFNKGSIAGKQIIFGISSSSYPLSKNFINLKKINLINNSYFYIINFIKKLPKTIKIIIIHNRPHFFFILKKKFPEIKFVLVFHNDPNGINAVGGFGNGLGAFGIQNGITIEFDTWDNGEVPEDHTQIKISNTWADLTAITKLPNIEDSQWHLVNFKWNASSQTLSYSLDGNLITDFTNDLVTNVFNNESSVYLGFTAGTGGAKNEQKIRFPDAFCNYPMFKDSDNDGVVNSLDTDSDGDFDALYSLGARSFSVWNAATGSQVFDSKNELDIKAKELAIYDDGRSDDKSVEPESVCIGRVGSKNIAIIGMERADAFAIYDITIPTAPVFIKMYKTGDAPEGLLFIPASKSPINQSLIVTSNENDGTVKIYKTTKM